MRESHARALLAEFAGTFALVAAGAGAIVVNHATDGAVTHVGIALTFGLVIAIGIAALGDCSGAHFNPAVTAALAATRRFPAGRAIPYILAQCAGAVVASVFLRLLFPADATLGATIPRGAWQVSFGLEIIMTLFLVGTILLVARPQNPSRALAPLAIGGVVAMDALFGGPISGASMNPARSFGPALISGRWEHHWIYWAAPLLAAGMAALTDRLLHRSTQPTNS